MYMRILSCAIPEVKMAIIGSIEITRPLLDGRVAQASRLDSSDLVVWEALVLKDSKVLLLGRVNFVVGICEWVLRRQGDGRSCQSDETQCNEHRSQRLELSRSEVMARLLVPCSRKPPNHLSLKEDSHSGVVIDQVQYFRTCRQGSAQSQLIGQVTFSIVQAYSKRRKGIMKCISYWMQAAKTRKTARLWELRCRSQRRLEQ